MLSQRSVADAHNFLQLSSSAGAEKIADMDELASRVLEKLKKAHIKGIAVTPFSLEKIGGHRTLSYQLSDSFAATLASIAGDIHVLDRAYMLQALQKQQWMSTDIPDPLVFRSVAFASGADALLHGTSHWRGDL
jgi:hypothetical protein